MHRNNHRVLSLHRSNHTNDEYEFDEVDDNGSLNETENSESSTDDASEAENTKGSEEYTEIKEQVYRDKLANLKSQLQQLNDGTHQEYLRIVKGLETQWKERLNLNLIMKDYLVDRVERDYVSEKRAATKELEEKKGELKQNLIAEMEEKRKTVEAERLSMELLGDSADSKPAMTRKLRRRPHDPAPLPEKRRGKSSAHVMHVTTLLEEKEIDADGKTVVRSLTQRENISRKPAQSTSISIPPPPLPLEPHEVPLKIMETRIEDGKLLYERRWFHRGQPVFVEGRDTPRFPAIISSIGSEVLWVKKTNDPSKVKILIAHLSNGKMTIKRRAA